MTALLLASLVTTIAPVVAPVMAATGCGYVWGRKRLPFDHMFVTRIITLISAPCLVFSSLVQARLEGPLVGTMSLATLSCLALFALLGGLGLKLLGARQRVYLPALIFPNIGNIGLPVCLFAFGPDGLSLAMVYFTVTSLLQFTAGEAIASGQWRLLTILKLPFLHAAVLAGLIRGLDLSPPLWLTNSTTLLGNLAVPLMLLALGVALAELRVTHIRRACYVAVARLGLGLASGGVVCWGLDLHGVMAGVVVVQSAMPVAVFNYLFAKLYDNDPQEVAGAVVMSTALAYATLPFLVFGVMAIL